MSLTKRNNSLNYYSEFVINKKRYIKSTGTTNRALAKKIDETYYREALEQAKLGGKTIKLLDALLKYQESIRGNEKRKKTMGYHINWINNNMDTSIPMHKVDTAFIHKYVELRFALDSKPGSVRHDVLIFSGAIDLMRKLGYDVCTVEMPSIKVKNGKDRVLSQVEEARLLAQLLPAKKQGTGNIKIEQQQNLYDLVVMLLDLGCRWCEASSVKWTDLDFDNKTIKIWRSKTSTAAILAMSNRLYDLLIEKERTCDWVFPNKTYDGPRIYNSTPFKAACLKAGIEDFSFHNLRHTRITRLTLAGLSLSQIKAVSGHSNLQSLQRYQHLTAGDVIDQVRDLLNKE